MFLLFWRSRVLGLFGVCLVLFCLFVVVVVVVVFGGEVTESRVIFIICSILSSVSCVDCWMVFFFYSVLQFSLCII